MASVTIKDIPEDVYAKFKAYCAIKRKKMRELLIEFMEEKSKELVIKEQE